jgi:predicted ATPase
MNLTSDKRLLQQVRLRNLLSFGPESEALQLENLNVLIGPNGAGKSNLIECLGLLQAFPTDLREVVRLGGGVSEWIWKGRNREAASVEVVVSNPNGKQSLRHILAFRDENHAFHLDDERIENETPYIGQPGPYFYYQYLEGHPMINTIEGGQRRLARETVAPDASILAQRRDPEFYPEISYLAASYGRIRIYKEWAFGRHTVFREPQKADMRNDQLQEDFSNLGLFLNRLRGKPKAKSFILQALRDLYEGVSDFDVSVESGSVQVFFTEGDFTIPATRLSDGTLRYLCLLAILGDPDPPPLICIEEPELGLHPDILPKLADHLVQASNHTQLIITTHSDILVDAMTDIPEAVVVCEKHGGQTEMKRLKREDLVDWVEKYRLGQLWTKGQLGGTRW